jgi:hypothetical protein
VTRPRFAAIAAPRRGFVSDFHTEEAQKEPKAAHKRADDAIFKTGQHSSSNALISVEPWRCRLPVVQTTRSERSWHKVTNVMGRR